MRCLHRPTLDTLSASTGYVWYRDSQHSTRSPSTGYVRCRDPPKSRHALIIHRVCAVPPQTNTRHALSLHRVCAVPRRTNTRHALRLHRVCVVPRQTNTRHALSLHRVCVVSRQPTLDTLSASKGYVWCRDSQHSSRSQPPQGMCGIETANTRHAQLPQGMCGIETANTRHAQLPQGMCGVETANTRHAQLPQGMCGVETANTRYALSLHRVCEVSRQPTLDTLSASTGYVWYRDSQHSTPSQPPQGLCGSETANTRHALSLHRVCVVPRQPTLDTLSASTGYVWYRDSQHSTRSQPPQGMCGIETANTRHAQLPQGM